MKKQIAAKRNPLGELMEGVGAMKAHREGKITLRTYPVAAPEIKASPTAKFFVAARGKFNVSRAVWASMLRVSPRTVEKWEQGGQASSIAATFVELVTRYPDTIERLQTLPRRVSRESQRIRTAANHRNLASTVRSGRRPGSAPASASPPNRSRCSPLGLGASARLRLDGSNQAHYLQRLNRLPGHINPLSVRPRIGRSQQQPCASTRAPVVGRQPLQFVAVGQGEPQPQPRSRGRSVKRLRTSRSGFAWSADPAGKVAHVAHPLHLLPTDAHHFAGQIQNLQLRLRLSEFGARVSGKPVTGELAHNDGFACRGHRSGLSHEPRRERRNHYCPFWLLPATLPTTSGACSQT